MKQEREYGIDALRIVAMWMIVVLHVMTHGGVLKNVVPGSGQDMSAWLLEAVVYGAVNCYGLISGYVGVKAKHRFSGIAALWIQVVFYSVLLSAVAHMLRPDTVWVREWVKGFLPVNLGFYWYYSAYFFASFFFPLLNRVLLEAPKEELAASLGTVAVLIPVNSFVFQRDVFMIGGGYSALWLMVLYMIGGMIRLHGDSLKVYQWIRRHAVLLFVLAVSAVWGLKMLLGDNTLSLRFDINISGGSLYSYTSPAVVLSSVALFAWFAGWKPGKRACKWISVISPAAFGVYLIHMHPQIWRILLYGSCAWIASVKAWLLPFAVLGAAAAIFAVCAVIDLLRGRLFRLLRVKEGCQWAFEKIGLS